MCPSVTSLWGLKGACDLRLQHYILHIMGSVELRPDVSIWVMDAHVVICNGTVIVDPTSIISKKAGIRIGKLSVHHEHNDNGL